MPTIDSSTWWPTPASRSAASRWRVATLNPSTISVSSPAATLVASITALTPSSAAASPSPVRTSTPSPRLIRTASCPAATRCRTARAPIRPEAPATATRIVVSTLSVVPVASMRRLEAIADIGYPQ